MNCINCGCGYEEKEQGIKPAKLDTGEIVFTEVMIIYTCKSNPNCELYNQTFTQHTFDKYTLDELLERYA